MEKRKKAKGGKYKAFLANYLPKGTEWSRLPDGKQILNRLPLKVGGFGMEIVNRPANFFISGSKLQGRCVHTADIVVENVKDNQVKRLEKIIAEVAELLSFATTSQVAQFGHRFGHDARQRMDVRGVVIVGRPAICDLHGSRIRDFIEQVWPTYHRIRKQRRLHIVIDYVVTTEQPDLPIEFEILASSATLECLKSTYAKFAGYKFVKGAWRKISSPPKANPGKELQVRFEKLLNEMGTAVSMRPIQKRIIQLRNDVIHNGFSTWSVQRQLKVTYAARQFVREYLLRLLGYKGTYYRYADHASLTLK